MKIEMKRPNLEMVSKIESMLNNFDKISTIASELKTQVVTIYRYASYLGYSRVMVSSEEMKLLVKYRDARKAMVAGISTPAKSTPTPAIASAATPVLGA
jgi:hypothetical protein